MECCIAYLCSLFSEVVHYRKSVKQRKPKAAIKGVCHRFSKSINADKNWSVQPKVIITIERYILYLDFTFFWVKIVHVISDPVIPLSRQCQFLFYLLRNFIQHMNM